MDVFDWVSLFDGAKALTDLLGIDSCSFIIRKSPYSGVEIVLPALDAYITFTGRSAYTNIKPQYLGISEGHWYFQGDKWFIDLV